MVSNVFKTPLTLKRKWSWISIFWVSLSIPEQIKFVIGSFWSRINARIYRPCFRENQPKRSFSIKWKRAFWACFRENWVYKFGHRRWGGMTWTGDFKCREVKTGFCRKRWMGKPVLLGLSLAGNLVKPLLSLYGTEWRERGYGLCPTFLKQINK